MNCPICDLPMVWSELHERTWCSIYGDHIGHEPAPPPRPEPKTVNRRSTSLAYD